MLRSIVGRLWLTMVMLNILVLVLLGALLVPLLENFYFQLREQEIVRDGTRIAALLGRTGGEGRLERDLELASGLVDAHLVVVDRNGLIIGSCLMDPWGMMGGHRGMMGGGMMGMGMMMRPGLPLETTEVEEVLRGRVVSRRGYHPVFETTLLTVAAPVTENGRVTGAVILYAPVAPISETIGRVRGLLLLAALGGIGLATLLSFFLSRNLSRPLLEMNRVAVALSRGDFREKVAVRGEDEIGTLGRSINRLSIELQQKQEAERRLEEMRQEFVANVSHELRTPLSYLQGYAEALIDEVPADQEERNRYLQVILEETLRLRRLVDELLDLSQLEKGQVRLAREPVFLPGVLERVATKVRPRAEEKGITLEVGIPPQLPAVLANEDRLEQLLFNLVDNAFRHTPRGGSVSLAAAAAGEKVEVSVRDTGDGIPPEDLPYIFERFYKVDKARTRGGEGTSGGEGTGLGLAIARGIVEAHGGKIEARSRPGEGTTFTFTLPVAPPGYNGTPAPGSAGQN